MGRSHSKDTSSVTDDNPDFRVCCSAWLQHKFSRKIKQKVYYLHMYSYWRTHVQQPHVSVEEKHSDIDSSYTWLQQPLEEHNSDDPNDIEIEEPCVFSDPSIKPYQERHVTFADDEPDHDRSSLEAYCPSSDAG